MNKMNKKGFTLIEMLVVIAIIAVLVSIIIPVVSSSTDKAKAATNAANLRSVKAEIVTQMLTDNDFDVATYAATITEDNGYKFYATDDCAANPVFEAEELVDANNKKTGEVEVKYGGLTIAEWADLAGSDDE